MEQRRQQKSVSTVQNRYNDRQRVTTLKVMCVIAVILFAAIIVLLIPRQYTVEGLSMIPTLSEGDSLYYTRFHTPGYGDLIVFHASEPEYGLIVKRIIGLSGDRITVNADGSVIRNGIPLKEPYIEPDTLGNSAMAEVTVEPDKLFVLGDNRAVSIDSRDARIGQISTSSVYGAIESVIRSFE